MSPDDPRHGSYAGYIQGCKCGPCLTANRRYDKTHRMRILNGEKPTVPINKAQNHLSYCINELGMRYEAFEEAGIRAPRRVLDGEHGYIHARTEAAILAVTPQPGVNWFPTHGARRRLQALIAIGHAQADIAERVGVTAQHMSMLVTGYRHYRIEPYLWKRIAAVYDEMSMQLGSSTRSRNRARKNEWPAPLAWDAIDDPTERPKDRYRPRAPRRNRGYDEAAVIRLLDGENVPHASRADRDEAMRRWVAAGRSERVLCEIQKWKAGRYGKRQEAVA